MKILGIKKYVWFIIALMVVIAIILSNKFISDYTRSAKYTSTEQIARIIEKSITRYINESEDNNLERIEFHNGGKLEVKSGKTKWSSLVLAMQENIITKNKHNAAEPIGTILESSNKIINFKDFLPEDPKYVGYKIDIYLDGKVSVIPWKKESECVVTIVK